jgi:hypothetical protein
MSTNASENAKENLVQIRPRPTACARIEDPNQVPLWRRLDCQDYDGCIDVAVEGGWDGFHCKGCEGYRPLTPQQRTRDLHSILEFLAETDVLPGVLKNVGMGMPNVLPEGAGTERAWREDVADEAGGGGEAFDVRDVAAFAAAAQAAGLGGGQ